MPRPKTVPPFAETMIEGVWRKCQAEAEADALPLDPGQLAEPEVRRTLAAVQFLAAVLGLVVTHGDRGDGRGAADLARRTLKALTGRNEPNYSKGK